MTNKNITGALFIIFAMLFSMQLGAKNGTGGSKGKMEKGEAKEVIVTLTPTNYDEVISKGIVFVDYWAAWCAPCRRMNPILKELAEEKAGVLTIAKLNVDEHREFSIKKEVFNLPTIIVYKDGKELARVAGLVPKEKLIEVVDYLVSVR